MTKKDYLIAGVAVTAALAGVVVGASVVKTKKYKKAYDNGLRLTSKSCGTPYYSNVFLVITNEKITPAQIRELTVMTGGSVEKSEETDLGVYTTFLLPEYHAMKDLDQLGQDIGAACDYVQFAGYLGVEEE